jgi:hypothetical protein
MAAGGNLNIRSAVANTVRVAGGNVVIEGPVTRDLLVAGGSVDVREEAAVGGDLLIGGGEITINAPVDGDILIGGGQVTINSEVGGSVRGNVGQLTLGSQAVISGDLSYKSEERARITDGAVVRGRHNFQQIQFDEKKAEGFLKGLVTAGVVYKLFADIIFALILVWVLRGLVLSVIADMKTRPVRNGLVGLLALVATPIVGLILLVVLWLGIVTLLGYGLLLISSAFVGKLFVGNFILSWWEQRSGRRYVLDWRAAIVGPVVTFIILAIPVIGWIIGFLVFLVSLGGIVSIFSGILQSQKKIVRPTKGRSR